MIHKILSIILCVSISLFSFLSWELLKLVQGEVLQNRHIVAFIDKNQNNLADILVELSNISLRIVDKQVDNEELLSSIAERQKERTALVSDIPQLRREIILSLQDIENIKSILLEITETIKKKNNEK